MRLQAKVTKVLEVRKGFNAQKKQEWKCTDLLISFEETMQNGAPIVHSTVASSWGDLDVEAVNKAVEDGTVLTLFVVFGTREWSGRHYCDNSVRFPTEFYNRQ